MPFPSPLEEGICRCIRASIPRPNVSILHRTRTPTFDVVRYLRPGGIADADGTDMHPVADEDAF